MFKLLKFTSANRDLQQANSTLSETAKLQAQITVPTDVGLVDTKESGIDMECELNVYDSTGTTIYFPATLASDSAGCLLKSCKTSCSKGPLPELTDINLETANMSHYSQSSAWADVHNVRSQPRKGIAADNINNLPDDLFNDYGPARPSDDGVAVSANPVNYVANLRIPMKVYDPVARGEDTVYYPMYGARLTHDIALPTEDQPVVDLVAMESHGDPCDDVAGVGGFIGTAANPLVTLRDATEFTKGTEPKFGDLATLHFKQATTGNSLVRTGTIAAATVVGGKYSITFTGNGIPVTGATEACEDVSIYWNPTSCDDITAATLGANTTVGNAARPLIIGGLFPNSDPDEYHRCPFYVGMPVLASCSHGAGAVNVDRSLKTIASLEISGTDLKITLDTPFTVTASQDVVNIRLASRDYAGASYNRLIPFLKIRQVSETLATRILTPDQDKAIRDQLKTGISVGAMLPKVTPITMTSDRTSYIASFETPENPDCCFLLTPQLNELVSGFDNFERYRFRLNGTKYVPSQWVYVDNTAENYDGLAGRDLHHAILREAFDRLGVVLRRYESIQNGRDRNYGVYALSLPAGVRQVEVDMRNGNSTSSSAKAMYLFAYKSGQFLFTDKAMQIA